MIPPSRVGTRSEAQVIGFLAFLGICLAFGVDASLPAFDNIRAAFALSPDSSTVSLTTSAYLLGMAGGQFVGGSLSDRFGRRSVLIAGLGIYAIGAAASAGAPTFAILLGGRFVWGIGAALPSVLRSAIARDLYSGDAMARITTISMAVFLLGPIIVPSIGAALLTVGSWRLVFATAVALAAVAVVWTVWFGETLPVERRRRLGRRDLVAALRVVLGNRSTMAYVVAQMFTSGAFFSYLGSSQPITDRIYGRGAQFPLYFGAAGIVMAVGLVINNRMIRRFGSRQVIWFLCRLIVAVAILGVVVTVAADGVPPFIVWFVWAAAVNALMTLLTPLFNAMALEPMGDVAGTASTVAGVAMFAGGAVLGGLIDASIGQTITAMPVGYTVYSVVALAAVAVARRAGRASSEASLKEY